MARGFTRVLTAVLVAAGVGVVTAEPAAAAGGYTAGGGPWNVRSCASTECDSVGTMPNGPIPDLICQVYGQRVVIVSYETSVWNRVRTPSGVTGYMTNAGVNETPAYGFDPALPRCSGTHGGSAHFRPYDPFWFWQDDPDADADFIVRRSEWSLGNCSFLHGGNYPDVVDGRRVSTLSAWSLGRLGPVYAMLNNFPRVKQSIDSIILFDPGSLEELTSPETCDATIPQDALYAEWLAHDPDNRLLILAGRVTRDEDHPDSEGRLHQGIQRALFGEIRGTPLAQQVLVCNYDDLSHHEVLSNFRHIVQDGPQSTCPTAPGVTLHWQWHP